MKFHVLHSGFAKSEIKYSGDCELYTVAESDNSSRFQRNDNNLSCRIHDKLITLCGKKLNQFVLHI